jgi:hypothetical protein
MAIICTWKILYSYISNKQQKVWQESHNHNFNSIGTKANCQRPDQKQDLDPNVKISNNCTIAFLNHEPSHAQ